MGSFRSRLALTAVLFAAVSCNSPTLPLPPPSVTVTAREQDAVTVAGEGASPNALVMVWNEDVERGVIVVASDRGRFEARVAVDFARKSYNTLAIWQRTSEGDSLASYLDVFALPSPEEEHDGGTVEIDGSPDVRATTDAPTD